jgi:4-amino-4-deoxychorismate lyase
MSRLIESIKLQDGKFINLFYHEQRMGYALAKLFGADQKIVLSEILERYSYPEKGLFKCRLVYDASMWEVSFVPYVPRNIRRIRVVDDNTISYPYKLEDRVQLQRLYDRRGECDDVLIIKAGKVTDCSFSNIVFRSGGKWFTPASPLLKGTMRQNLLDKKIIHEREILKTDISGFETFKIINAMLEFDSAEIAVSEFVF